MIACFPGATFISGLFGGALLGFFLAFVAYGILDSRAVKSPAYVAASAERQRELDAIDRSGPPPAPAPSTSTPAKPTPSTRAKVPAPCLVRGDYTIEPPTETIAADKSPEQRARDRAANVNQDPAA
ncbi:hypothetical protein [Burkholderia cepacia]|uniref:hypothetical protein n=1 Tax=Burkholderia cepacia TaxID=292 RepID=UPI003EE088F9